MLGGGGKDSHNEGATAESVRLQISEDQSRMFKLIEDADLWRWVVPDSLSFHAGVAVPPG